MRQTNIGCKKRGTYCLSRKQAGFRIVSRSRATRTEHKSSRWRSIGAHAPRLAFTARVILEALLKRYTKRDCHFERSLKRRRILVLFDGYNCLPCDAHFDRRVPAASSRGGPGVLESDCVWRASERLPVSHNLGGGFRDIRDHQHPKEDAQEMKSYHPAVQSKMADGRVKPQHAQPDHHK